MVSASDLVVMDPEELELKLAESRRELLNLRFQLATGQLDNTARMGQVKKDVARILTVLRDREIQEAEGTYVPPTPRRRVARVAALEEDTGSDEAEADDEADDEIAEEEG
jgi:large subunit ribosomal protein L29